MSLPTPALLTPTGLRRLAAATTLGTLLTLTACGGDAGSDTEAPGGVAVENCGE